MPKTIPDKQTLRNQALKSLRTIQGEVRAKASQLIAVRLNQLCTKHSHIMAFWPLNSEPDIRKVLHKLNQVGKSLYLPCVAEKHIIPYKVDDLSTLKPSKLGVHEPARDTSLMIHPEQVELVILPGLAFTPKGSRLGRGGGYYDRFLSTLPEETLKVAVAYESQVHQAIPINLHDIGVDVIITDCNEYRCRNTV